MSILRAERFKRGRPNLDEDRWLWWLVVWFPLFFVIVSLCVKAFTPSLYFFSIKEDGFIEWNTALAFAAAAVFAALLAGRLWLDSRAVLALLYAGLAAGMMLAVLEEISWGQRVLDIETPDYFVELSTKEEINIHNLKQFPLDLAFATVGFYGAFSRLLAPGALRRRFPFEGGVPDSALRGRGIFPADLCAQHILRVRVLHSDSSARHHDPTRVSMARSVHHRQGSGARGAAPRHRVSSVRAGQLATPQGHLLSRRKPFWRSLYRYSARRFRSPRPFSAPLASRRSTRRFSPLRSAIVPGCFCCLAVRLEVHRVSRMARQHPMLDCASHPRCQRSSTRAGVPRQTWIEEHFAAHNPVDGMPERSRLPRTTFARRFRKATGYAPMEYVHTIRVERAKLLLEQTTDPVEHIGGRVGYEDIASFRRLFKRKKSLTPTEYRRSFGDLCFIKLKDAVTPSTAYRLTDTIGEAGADDAPSRGIQ